MSYDADGWKESVGSALSFDSRRVKGELDRFKEFIESRQVETGSWRGDVRQGEVMGR
jgi:tRNA(His) 5'-end guanylyltransferase